MALISFHRHNLRTNPKQFEIMLNFMEQYGDLGRKLATYSKDRIQILQDWEELTIQLNATGKKKPVEKWKKVWSDLKNNTKRKALKLRAALHAGGSITLSKGTRLTDLEQRVLKLLPEFNKEEFTEESVISLDTDKTVMLLSPVQDRVGLSSVSQPVFVELAGFTPQIEASPTRTTSQLISNEGPEETVEPRPVRETSPFPLFMTESTLKQPDSLIPAIEGHAPITEVTSKRYTSSRSKQRVRDKRINDKLISYVIQKGQAELEMEKERLRLKEIELDIQKHWQNVAVKAIDALYKVVESKFN